MQLLITESQFGLMQMMEEVSEHVQINFRENFDSTNVDQPVKDFLFP